MYQTKFLSTNSYDDIFVLEIAYELMKDMKKDEITMHLIPFNGVYRANMMKRTRLIARMFEMYIEIEGVEL